MVRWLLAAVVLLGALLVQPAAAQPAVSPMYLAAGGGAVSLAVVDGKAILADAKDTRSQWTYDKESLLYKNVSTSQCIAALSPVDGLTLKMADCDASDRYQQWRRAPGQPGLVVISNVATARCLTAEGTAPGARVYQEVCSLTGLPNYWAAGGRTLAIISGNLQRLTAQSGGAPFVIKVIGDNGQPAAGVPVNFYVRSARAKNYLVFETGAETATAPTGEDGIASSPKLKLSEPGEFDIRFAGSASLDDGNSVAFEGSCLC